jgi:hypothetical protein
MENEVRFVIGVSSLIGLAIGSSAASPVFFRFVTHVFVLVAIFIGSIWYTLGFMFAVYSFTCIFMGNFLGGSIRKYFKGQ